MTSNLLFTLLLAGRRIKQQQQDDDDAEQQQAGNKTYDHRGHTLRRPLQHRRL